MKSEKGRLDVAFLILFVLGLLIVIIFFILPLVLVAHEGIPNRENVNRANSISDLSSFTNFTVWYIYTDQDGKVSVSEPYSIQTLDPGTEVNPSRYEDNLLVYDLEPNSSYYFVTNYRSNTKFMTDDGQKLMVIDYSVTSQNILFAGLPPYPTATPTSYQVQPEPTMTLVPDYSTQSTVQTVTQPSQALQVEDSTATNQPGLINVVWLRRDGMIPEPIYATLDKIPEGFYEANQQICPSMFFQYIEFPAIDKDGFIVVIGGYSNDSNPVRSNGKGGVSFDQCYGGTKFTLYTAK